MSKPPKNYRWWQDHGQGWVEEVALRKAQMPIYHLQEIFLEGLLSKAAPAKVLDFGCGFGRHLEYLRKIPKLDLYGFDQSESMLEGMRWAKPAWRKKRISIGKPLNKLPYADDSFDIVFTVSVLIHVRPRDLDRVIGELWRVSRGQVIHIENNDTDETFETSDAHDGCWAHDLRSAYERVAPAAVFEVAPSLFELEDVYRVSQTEVPLPEIISASRAERFLALDQSLSGEIRSLRDRSDQSGHRAEMLQSESKRLHERLEGALVRAREAEESLEPARERARSAEDGRDELLTRARSVEERVASLQERAVAAESRIPEIEIRLHDVIDRAHAAESSIEALHERAVDAEAKHAEALAEVERAREILALRDARVAELTPLVEALRERAHAAEALVVDLRTRALEAEGKGTALIERIDAVQLASSQHLARARAAEAQSEESLERARAAEGRLSDLREHANRLTAELAGETSLYAEAERKLRSLRDREESATARVAVLLERLEVEVARADVLDSAVMRAHGAHERVLEQVRDAQSRIIALRRRSERGEAKANTQRLRARAAEAEIVRVYDEVVQLQREQALERERADEALGRIDEAHREQERVETKLEALRAELTGILGQ